MKQMDQKFQATLKLIIINILSIHVAAGTEATVCPAKEILIFRTDLLND